jgi:hypothetical protein
MSSLPFHFSKFPIYHATKTIFTGGVEEPPLPRLVLASSFTALISSILATPGEILKVRMINDVNKEKYKSNIK